MLDGGEAPAEGHLDEGDEGADAPLLHHLLVLLIGAVGAARAAVQGVQAGAGAATEADHPPTGDRLRDGNPFAFRITGDDDLVAEGDGAGDEGLHCRGLAAAVRAEHEDVGGERAAFGGVDVRLPWGEVPQRVCVQVDAEDGAAVAEAAVGDERVDPGDVLTGGLMRGDHRRREIPIPAAEDARAERSRHRRLG